MLSGSPEEKRSAAPEGGAGARRTLVLGVGNRLMSDDAVGLEALEAFRAAYELPPGVEVLDGGTGGLDLLGHLEGCAHVLVVDCVSTGAEPGALLRVEAHDVPRVFSRSLSPHQMGLPDLLAALELTGRLPERLVVLGVEPARVDLGLELTEPVARRLPALVEAMAAELAAWGVAIRKRPGR
ncbi:MAG: HyaD/HybD family hydrogenase maturation endopeptidase [Deferrisomatales bacterium]